MVGGYPARSYSKLRFWATDLTGAFATEVDTVLLTADGVLRPTNVGFTATFFALVVVVTGIFGWVLPDVPGFAVRASFAGIVVGDVVTPEFGSVVPAPAALPLVPFRALVVDV